jgi:hypothetical protein
MESDRAVPSQVVLLRLLFGHARLPGSAMTIIARRLLHYEDSVLERSLAIGMIDAV